MAIRAIGNEVPRMELGVALEEYPMGLEGFIADDVLPVRLVKDKEASFNVITRESILRRVNVRRSVGGAYGRTGFDTDIVSYRCEEFGLEGALPDETIRFYDSVFDAEMVVAGGVKGDLAREREIRVAAAIFDTAVFTGAPLFTEIGTDWDQAAATIVVDIDAAKEKVRLNCGLLPNVMVIGAGVVPWLKFNTDLKARLQYTQALVDNAITGQLASLFGISKVLIGGQITNSASEGETYASSDIWSSMYCWIGRVPATQSMAEPGIGRTMLWEGDSPSIYTVEEYRENQTRKTVYRVRHHLQEKIIDPLYGHLLKIDT